MWFPGGRRWHANISVNGADGPGAEMPIPVRANSHAKAASTALTSHSTEESAFGVSQSTHQ